MQDRRILPSQHLPEHLRMDLGVGTDHAHPITQAIDDIVNRLLDLSSRIAVSLNPDLLTPDRIRQTLEFRSFKVGTLNTNEQERLHHSLNAILALRGTLRSVQLLAEVYFHGAEVQRGGHILTERS